MNMATVFQKHVTDSFALFEQPGQILHEVLLVIKDCDLHNARTAIDEITETFPAYQAAGLHWKVETVPNEINGDEFDRRSKQAYEEWAA
jgi:hypothetical protein